LSYVLHVWEGPAPSSVAEADGIHARLSKERRPQNPKFIDFAKRLTERYPCITTLDDDDPEAVWSDGPLDGKTETPVYGVGVSTSHLDAVVPFVAATARDLGLMVYDTQAGEVHLPSGRVLTMPGRSSVRFSAQDNGDLEQLDNKAQVLQIIQERLRPMMESFGFKALRIHASFKRQHMECEQTLSFGVTEGHPCFSLTVHFKVKPVLAPRFQMIADRVARHGWYLDLKAAADSVGARPFGDAASSDAISKVKDIPGLRDWLEGLATFLAGVVMPIADRCGTARDMDGLVNPGPQAIAVFVKPPTANALILAFSAQNDRLEELIADWRNKTPPGVPRESLETLISDLQAAAAL
jgi:hypothetical protein